MTESKSILEQFVGLQLRLSLVSSPHPLIGNLVGLLIDTQGTLLVFETDELVYINMAHVTKFSVLSDPSAI